MNDAVSTFYFRDVGIERGYFVLYDGNKRDGNRTIVFLDEWEENKVVDINHWYLQDRASSLDWKLPYGDRVHLFDNVGGTGLSYSFGLTALTATGDKLALLLCSGAGYSIARKALRPVEQVTEAASDFILRLHILSIWLGISVKAVGSGISSLFRQIQSKGGNVSYQQRFLRGDVGARTLVWFSSHQLKTRFNCCGARFSVSSPDGMTEALIADLTQIGSLKVISCTSSIRFNSDSANVRSLISMCLRVHLPPKVLPSSRFARTRRRFFFLASSKGPRRKISGK